MSPLTRLAWWWLRRRGWAVQMNRPQDCIDHYERDGKVYNRGWQPIFSIRYGKTPVWRVGPDRMPEYLR